MIFLPATSFHFRTHRASTTLVASLRGMRLYAPDVCQRMISSYTACRQLSSSYVCLHLGQNVVLPFDDRLLLAADMDLEHMIPSLSQNVPDHFSFGWHKEPTHLR